MTEDNKSKAYLVVCPMCKGEGYCEEIKNPIVMPDVKESGDEEKRNKTGSAALCKPKIGGAQRKISTPTKPTMKTKIENKMPILPNKVTSSPSPGYKEPKKDVQSRFTNLTRPGSRGSVASESSEMGMDLIGFEEVENPVEYSKIIKAQLTSTCWMNHISGLQRAVHLSRVEPDIAVEMGCLICRTILSELTSLRSKCVRIACQCAREIFRIGGGFIFRPVFDEIVNVLLNRTADSKKIIRDDADEALCIIASYCPVQHVTRAFQRGIKHKHQLVRKSALKMLKTIVNRIGVLSLIKTNNYHDVRGSLLEAGFVFLEDTISEIRNSAKELMGPIVKMPEFDRIIPEINKTSYKRVEKTIFNLKYDMDRRKKIPS